MLLLHSIGLLAVGVVHDDEAEAVAYWNAHAPLAPKCAALKPSERVDCGFPGVTPASCLRNANCCYGGNKLGPCSAQVPCCYYSAGHGPPPLPPCAQRANATACAQATPDPKDKTRCTWHAGSDRCVTAKPVTTVHVVQSCHLDVGFADTCAGILNRYFDKFYDAVVANAANLTAEGGEARLTFMTFPYLISIFMDCPAWPGLHCPTPAAKVAVKAALKSGELWLAGFPHSGEPETFDATTLAAALKLSRSVALENGGQPSAAYSQRDVPGITRAAVPTFARNGIRIVSVGSNGINEAPIPLAASDTAPVFRWRVNDEEVYVLLHRGGYGGDGLADCHVADDEVLCPFWKGDNSGPDSPKDIKAQWAKIRKEFPHATTVRTARFDDFIPALMRANASGELPVLTAELGDTWIHGMQSDPFKTKAMRAMMRARTACISDGSCQETDPKIANFTRLIMKNGEHTWGKDVKSYLGKDQKSYMQAWTNGQLASARKTKKNFQDMEASWREQRLWGIGSALEALGSHPMAAALRAELAPPAGPPSTAGLQLTQKRSFALPGFKAPLSIGADGAVSLGAAGSAFFAFTYRSYSAVDMANYDAQYRANQPGSTGPGCGDRDFCKPGMPGMPNVTNGKAESKVWTPTLSSVHTNGKGRFALELSLPNEAHTSYGAPATVWLSLNVTNDELSASVTVLGKTPTRLPEAAFVTFNPAAAGSWSNEILGISNNATDVVSHGSQHLHASEAVTWRGAGGGRMRAASLDAGLLCYGEPTAFPTSAGTAAGATKPFGPPDLLKGASWNLWNNIWGTNYPQWYPFEEADANMEYGFVMQLTDAIAIPSPS